MHVELFSYFSVQFVPMATFCILEIYHMSGQIGAQLIQTLSQGYRIRSAIQKFDRYTASQISFPASLFVLVDRIRLRPIKKESSN